MDDLPFTLPYPTWASFYNLPAEDKEMIKAAVLPFVNQPEEQWPRLGARKIEMEEPEYQIRVGDRWRVYLRPRPGALPELADFVRPEVLKLFGSKNP